MVGQNGASSATEIRPQAIRTGAAALVSGRFRVSLGRLVLSDRDLSFVSEVDDKVIVLPLEQMAWIDVSPRSRKLTLEITMRGAVIHYLRIDAADWVTSLRKARERALIAPAVGIHHQSIALAG